MASKLLDNPKALLNITRRITLEAGEVALSHFDETGYRGATLKSDGSPVTAADHETEALIEEALLKLFPDVPVVGEEAVSLGKLPDLKNAPFFWLIDPIDGTREFVAGSPDFTVNIALIKEGKPLIGVVYAPALGELYAGLNTPEEKLAVRWLEETDKEKEIHVRRPPREGLHVITGRRSKNGEKLDHFLEGFKVAKTTRRGSSIKFCMIACGKADLYPQFGQTCQWDTAAGHAVLAGAGGDLTNMQGVPFTYTADDLDFCNLEFVASGFEWFSADEAE
ncbi:MAG: 3'(2'),5'-bisphosphate nucleotidase CysQ [Alphaproteobacteria bacterium]|nr:3'(2'),5'-bisphosphate nucleotidase CysQ [Alphaproteobacteria bacterium]